MSLFKQRVIEIIKAIPYGKVMSYGQIAAYTGSPRAARQVGWILHNSESEQLPWWRVINNEGRITIKGSIYSPEIQAELLRQDGVVVSNENTVDIKQYRYIPDQQTLKNWHLPEAYIQILHTKYL